jgi:Family of unknown function (DUF6101)
MASVTQVIGEACAEQVLSDDIISSEIAAKAAAPAIERIAGTRILRGGAGWRGIALRLANGSRSETCFELALTAGDGRSISIATIDEEDAVALWRDCGKASQLPLILETGDGVQSEPYPMLGPLQLGAIRIRRRHALLAGRRPRFLARRKTTRLADNPVMVVGVTMFE